MKRVITEVFTKNTRRNFFAALAFAGVSAGAYAQQKGQCGSGVEWEINSTTLTISYTGSGTGEMDNYDNSIFPPPWYPQQANIKTLVIDSGVTSIGNWAFADCHGFTGSLTIPNSVINIGNCAFRKCNGFTDSLTIPNSVTTIRDEAFSDCSGFRGSLTIGNSVTTIGDGAFGYCSGFRGSLTIPNSVTTIGGKAFVSCIGFTGSLTIGNSVTSIGNDAFFDCRHFTSITSNAIIPPALKGIDVFDYFLITIPVYVPCGTSKNYQSVWNFFPNYIEYADTTSHTAAICRGETYADADFADLMQAGTYYKTRVDVRGCDSIIQLTLTVNPLPEPRISRNGNVLTASTASGYQWYYNNEIIPGATVQSYTCTEDGIYFVEIGNGYGCKARSADINIYLIVGINNYEPQTTNYEVYPNPTTGKLSVVSYQLSETGGEVKMYDVVGQVVFVSALSPQSPETTIDISGLASGLYFLKVNNKVIKVIKQ